MVSRREFLKKTTLAAAGSAVFMGFPKLANASRTCSVVISTSVLRGWMHSQGGKQGKYLTCLSGGGLRLGSLTKTQQLRDRVQSSIDYYVNGCNNAGVPAPLMSCSLVQQDGGGVTDPAIVQNLMIAPAAPVLPVLNANGVYQGVGGGAPPSTVTSVYAATAGQPNPFTYPRLGYVGGIILETGLMASFVFAGVFYSYLKANQANIEYLINNAGHPTFPNTWDYGMDYGSSQNQNFDYGPTIGPDAPNYVSADPGVINQVIPEWIPFANDDLMQGVPPGDGFTGIDLTVYV